jgi:hypothetical protein
MSRSHADPHDPDPILYFRQSDRDRLQSYRYWLIGLTCLTLSEPWIHQGFSLAIGLVGGI